MIDLTLALDLAAAGLGWTPSPGDTFAVTRTEMIDDVFHLADMVIETRDLGSGTVFAFNGTTEWALDSVPQRDTVWLPDEAQLRDALGSDFLSLHRDGDSFVVTVASGAQYRDTHAENAYAKALFAVLAPAASQ